MFKKLSKQLAVFLAPSYFKEIEERVLKAEEKALTAEERANQRLVQTLAQMDPLEPAMKEFHGIFSKEFEKPEQKLDERSYLGFIMWAYQQKTDPHFNYMIDWIMNSAGNETIKRAPITEARTQYGRAQISNMVLFRKEIGRLSSLYEEKLEKNKDVYKENGSTVD